MELQGKSLLVSVRDDENNERSASKLRDQLDASAQEHLNVIKEKYVVTFYATCLGDDTCFFCFSNSFHTHTHTHLYQVRRSCDDGDTSSLLRSNRDESVGELVRGNSSRREKERGMDWTHYYRTGQGGEGSTS